MLARILIAFLLTAAAPDTARGAEEAVRHFDEGNRLYARGDFGGAIDRYRQAIASGYASAALYYNMGNTFLRLDEIGEAIRYYEKAGRWMPDSRELAHNLAVARERTVDNFSRRPESFWRPFWDRIVGLFSPAGLLIVGLVFYVTAAVATAVRIRRGPSPGLRRVVLLSAAIGACFVVFGFAASYDRAHRVRAVVLVDEVALLDRPAGSGTVQVHEGTLVEVLGTRAEWSEIRLPNGVRGWMHVDAYGTI